MSLSRLHAPELPQALPDKASLERYTYYVAGVVGEFWTMLCEANLPAMRNSATLSRRKELARRFGQGLQLTNILKDVGKDLQSGRCYLPADAIRELGLRPRDLLDPATLQRIRPLIVSLIQDALQHLDHGVRLCATVAQASLEGAPELHVAVVVRSSDTWKRSAGRIPCCVVGIRVKISRRAVYGTMLRSLWYLAVPSAFEHRYASQRRRLARAMSLCHQQD